MRTVVILVVILFLTACESTKLVIKKPYEEVTSVEKTKDTVFQLVNDSLTKTINNNTENDTVHFQQIQSKKIMPIHQLWDELLQKNVSSNGNVNYKLFKKEHKKLLDYIYVLSLMYLHDSFKSLPENEKLAYWINAYNAFTIDLILRSYPIKSIKDIKDPWEQRLWKLGEKWYNLNDIEHQILRRMDEPRIHFAIVCASYSCPKLQNEAYNSEILESQLTNATKAFLSDSNRNFISENNLEISKIFQWFTKDFKKDGSLIDFLNQYSEIQISEKAKIKYKDYNWDLNE